MGFQVTAHRQNWYQFVAQEDGKTIVGEVAELDGNIDRVQRMRAANIDNATMGRPYASIPLVALAAWCNKVGLDVAEAAANDKILDRFLAEHGKFLIEKGWQ